MPSGRRYRKPPVVEALCEIYFVGSAWDDTVPGRLYDRVKDQFPVKRQREIHEAEVALSAMGEAAARVRRLQPWMQFISESRDRMIQLGQDLIVVNQLQPYPHFEDWEPVIYSTLSIYGELARPQGIAKIGVRYINKVVIPQPTIKMEDYFAIYPQIPAAMGDAHGAFMVRVELPSQKGGHTVLVTFGSAPADTPGEIAHSLDLYDIFSAARPVALEDLPNEVRTAHENVNAAFEGSITERLRQLFEPED